MGSLIKLSSRATNDFWEIPILFEDPHLIAFDKPAGLLVSPDANDPTRPSLMALARRDISRQASWVVERGISYLENTHRLDRETSGILLVAKDKPTLIGLANQFGNETPCKDYAALVRGTPKSDTFTVDLKLASAPDESGQIRPDSKKGKKAITHFEVLEVFSGYALVRCKPLTNRRHQIRVHLSRQSLPLAGDSLYGGGALNLSSLKKNYRLKPDKTERPLLGMPALHCEAIRFRHPETSQDLAVTAPFPKDLLVALKYLRLYAPPSAGFPI